MTERTIPVYIAGPSHGQPVPPRAHAVMLALAPREPGPHEPAPREPEVYRRRTFRVGGLDVHLWAHDRHGPGADTALAEELWRWLLDAAGTFAVGGLAVHLWAHDGPVRFADTARAEELWRWLLDAAGVPE